MKDWIKVMVCEDFEDIRNLSDCNLTRIQNHLVDKQTPKYLAKVLLYELID